MSPRSKASFDASCTDRAKALQVLIVTSAGDLSKEKEKEGAYHGVTCTHAPPIGQVLRDLPSEAVAYGVLFADSIHCPLST